MDAEPITPAAHRERRREMAQDVEEMRLRLVMSYQDLADLTHDLDTATAMSKTTVYRILTGKTVPNYSSLRRLMGAIEKVVDKRGIEV